MLTTCTMAFAGIAIAVSVVDPEFHVGGLAGAASIQSSEAAMLSETEELRHDLKMAMEHRELEAANVKLKTVLQEISEVFTKGAHRTNSQADVAAAKGWLTMPKEEQKYQTAINFQVSKMIRDKSDTHGKTRLELNTIHKITFEPGEAKFKAKFPGEAKFGICDMYPGETTETYISTRQTNGCDIVNMRNHDITPTDNPVPPLRHANKLYTLWEARKSKHVLSHYLCPNTIGGGSKDDSTESIEALNIWTYGGEAEVKLMKINLKKTSGNGRKESWSSTFDKKMKSNMYGTHLIQFMHDNKELARMEAESAHSIDIIFVEFVTAPIETTETNRHLIKRIYAAMENIKAGTLEQLPKAFSHDLLKSAWEHKKDNVDNLITAQIPRGTLGYLNETFNLGGNDLKITGMDHIRDGVCQGNYMLPLRTIITAEFVNNVDNDKYKAARDAAERLVKKHFVNVTVIGTNLVEHVIGDEDKQDLTAMFTIHIYNSYFFAMYNSKEDTQKDLWGQLPKTPVLDIVRALSETAKAVLVNWVKLD